MNIINLGILAHIDAGKTSVTENLLFASGATEKCGRVDNGDTITDSMDIEKRRGITVRASTTSIIWNGEKCNIIDTPGHMDFMAHPTFRVMRQSCSAYSLSLKYLSSLKPYALRFITFILLFIPSTLAVEI